MWNESFSGEAGGWGGDVSFATSAPKDSQSNRVADRLPVPVSITDLATNSSTDEKYLLGDYGFSTVLVMGIVKSVEEQEQSIVYTVYDPEDNEKEYRLIMYQGLSTPKTSDTFVEGTRVMGLGKIRSYNDTFGIIAYDIMEVSNDKDYHVYTLEAKIAKLFFSKGVPNKLTAPEGASLRGTCVGGPANSEKGTTTTTSEASSHAQPNRLYSGGNNTATSGVAASNGIEGQKGHILRVLETEQSNYGDNGLSVDDIKIKVGAPSVESVRADLEFLSTEGHVYTTINDDYYALIN